MEARGSAHAPNGAHPTVHRAGLRRRHARDGRGCAGRVLRRAMDSLAQRGRAPAFVERVLRLLSPEAAHAPGEVRSQAAPAVPPTGSLRPDCLRRVRPRRDQRQRVLSDRGSRGHRRRLLCGGQVVAVEAVCSRCADLVIPTVQAGTPAQGAIPEKSIAVLPFIDMSEKKDQEYFSDGSERGTHRPAGAGPGPAGAGPHLVVRLQGQGGRRPEHCSETARRARPRRAACAKLATRSG